MEFITGYNNYETTLSTLGDQVKAGNPARLMDSVLISVFYLKFSSQSSLIAGVSL
jgi:hypothetical protein